MEQNSDFLFEVGCEELPPLELGELARSMATQFAKLAGDAQLSFEELHPYAAPRRLALLVRGLARRQPDQRFERIGPPTGNSKAAQGFAQSCRVAVQDLQVASTSKGERWMWSGIVAGKSSVELLPQIVATMLAELPARKRMRWGAEEHEFVRPARWLVALLDDQPLALETLGLTAGRATRGHRFHADRELPLDAAGDYEETLRSQGWVIADFARRRDAIRSQIDAIAQKHGATPVIDSALLDEVTALVEWPVALDGGFDRSFLDLPEEILMAVMKVHQRYFSLRSPAGELLPRFITVANIDSSKPEEVVRGNERVVKPRLEDAAFFYRNDRKRSLEQWSRELRAMVFHRDLGTLAEKCQRIAALAEHLHDAGRFDLQATLRAARLAKADLSCAVVQEFDSLQGVVGGYYAEADGEPAAVASAVAEHYLPRFSGDRLPASREGMALGLADRIDTLVGIFSVGEQPTSSRDPFALRRAASGALRLILAAEWPLDLRATLWRHAAQAYRLPEAQAEELASQALAFINARFSIWCEEVRATADMLRAVMARCEDRPMDVARGVLALRDFLARDEAAQLLAAHKRVASILDGLEGFAEPDSNLFENDSEKQLSDALFANLPLVVRARSNGDFCAALEALAKLSGPVERFFENTLVMHRAENVRANRLALLDSVRKCFDLVAKFSYLSANPIN